MDPVAIVILVLCVAVMGGLVAARGTLIARVQNMPKLLPHEPATSPAGPVNQLVTVLGQVDRDRAPMTAAAIPEAQVVARGDARSPRYEAEERAGAALEARLSDFERQLREVSHAIELQRAEVRADLTALTAVVNGSQVAMRSDLNALQHAVYDSSATSCHAESLARKTAMTTRRLDVGADLYLRLARLEAAIAAVTNPMLLPGEPYVPPREFLPESLIWENWSDVGERAFALADGLSVNRLVLSAECRETLGTFVTTLRTRLTQEVYPNLQPEPTVAQQQALRAVLEQVARDLPFARTALEREYQSVGINA